MHTQLVQDLKIVEALGPAADAAGRTGAYVSLKNTIGPVSIVVHITQGAANTVALTVEKATAIAGTGSTAITVAVPIWANEDTATSDTMVKQTDALSFTTSAALKHKLIVFQIDPATLGAFDCLTVKTGTSAAANITQAVYVLPMSYTTATPPSAVVD